MRAMDDLVRVGKVLYIGFSDTPAYIISKADLLAELRGLAPVVAVQLPYNLLRRDPERELLPMAREQDIGVIAWDLIGAGVLSGKYSQPGAVKRHESASSEWLDAADQVGVIASQVGRTPAQVAIRWVYQQQARAQIIPILGARSLAQIEENLGILDFELRQEQLAELDAIAKFDPGFPWTFLHSEGVLNLVHGKTAGRLDNHRA